MTTTTQPTFDWKTSASGKLVAFLPCSARAMVRPDGSGAAWEITYNDRTKRGTAASLDLAKAAVWADYERSIIARWLRGKHDGAGSFRAPLDVGGE